MMKVSSVEITEQRFANLDDSCSMNHLYLTGFRGTGKSAVGALLGQKLELPLVDLDAVIESDAKKTIGEIFKKGGEARFRELETLALQRIASQSASVVSLGGGAILSDRNREWIAQSGWCVWLDADPSTILERIESDSMSGQRRPALTALPLLEEIQQLLETRRPMYQQASMHRIDTSNQSLESIAAEIVELYRQWQSK